MNRRRTSLKLIPIATCGLAALALLGCGGSGGDGSDLTGAGSREGAEVEIVDAVAEDRGETGPRALACSGVEEPTEFRQFSLGRSYDGFELTSVLRQCAPGGGKRSIQRMNSITYIYGTCDPGGSLLQPAEGGCAPPIQVETSRACVRNP